MTIFLIIITGAITSMISFFLYRQGLIDGIDMKSGKKLKRLFARDKTNLTTNIESQIDNEIKSENEKTVAKEKSDKGETDKYYDYLNKFKVDLP